MGKTGTTRAGATGSYNTDYLKGFKNDGTAWSEEQAKAQGFGVFAYYTGKYTYGQQQGGTYTSEPTPQTNIAPNFMFNQLVWWDKTINGEYITKWNYAPLKYWPNEVGTTVTHDVDDQNNDTSNDPAQGSGANSGNVSFFAYAPYVELNTTAITGDGITAINNGTTLAAANGVTGDPIISYKLPTAVATKAVDLLWGTAGTNGAGVAGAANAGVQGGSAPNTYVGSILDSYRTNADLTKQTTGGTIEFAFKHALAKIGGSYTGTGVGDDEDGTTATNGLLVILDLDDEKGAERGGSLEEYMGKPAASKPEWNRYNTKVTIDEIVIESDKQLTDDGVAAIESNLDFDYTSDTYTEKLNNSGKFNLATGKWTDLNNAETTIYKQTISQSTEAPGASGYGTSVTDKTKDGIISEELAEPASAPAATKAGFESLPIGVTTVAKNVFETESAPLVFIPGTKPVISFTITYTVRTYDPNLSTSYTVVKQKIKKNLYILKAVELNKQYNILMHLGLTGVKFTATVSDWEQTDAVGTTTPGTDGASDVTVYDDEVEHIYLPINVSEPTSVAATMSVATGGDANLAAKAFTAGSDETAVGTVTAMKATFPGDESAKSVELSHVVIKSDADWITYNPATNTFSVTENTSIDDRTATVRVTYDNVSDDYTITQKGMKVISAALKIYTDATASSEVTVTSNVTAFQPSASTKYYTRIVGDKKHVNCSDAVVGDAESYKESTGYTLTAGEFTTINGTTVTTKQNNKLDATTGLAEKRTETSTNGVGIVGTYDGVTVSEVRFAQSAATLKSINLTVGGSTSTRTYSASTTATGTFAVEAVFQDSKGVSAGSVTVPYTELVSAATDNKYSVITDGSATLVMTYVAADGNAIFTANSGTTTLSGTVKVQFGTGGTPITSNVITIQQTAP